MDESVINLGFTDDSGSAKKSICCSKSAKTRSCCSEPKKTSSCCSEPGKASICCSEPEKASSCCSEPEKASSCCSEPEKANSCCSEPEKANSCCSEPEKASSCCSESAKESGCCSGPKSDDKPALHAQKSGEERENCSSSSQKSLPKTACCTELSKEEKGRCCDSAGTLSDACSPPMNTASVCCTSAVSTNNTKTDQFIQATGNASEIKTAVKTGQAENNPVGFRSEEKSSCCKGGDGNKSSCSSKATNKRDAEFRAASARNDEVGSDASIAPLIDMGNKVTYGSFNCYESVNDAVSFLSCKDGGNDTAYVTIPCDVNEVDKEKQEADETVRPVDVITTTKLRIQNICCGKEAELMKRELEPLDGIEAVSVNVVGRIGFVKHNAGVISTAKIVSVLNDLHLGVSIMESGHNDDNAALNKEYRIRLGLKLGILFVLTSLFIPLIVGRVYKEEWRKWVAVAEIIIGGLPILRKAVMNWRKKVFIDINVLMLIAVIGTVVLQEWLEGATVVFVFAIAECLQEYCTYRVQRAISGLMVRIPDEAVLAEIGKSVPVEDVTIGSIIVACAGEKIPLDGKVIKGQASVDESSITGESMPIEKSQDDKTYSGTILQNGYLEIETTSDAMNSTVAKVTQMVQEAQGKASRTEKVMNKFAKFYTPIVLTAALLIFAIPAILAEAKVGNYAAELHEWGNRALIVLLIACPCALIMSVPMPMVCGITAAARNGVLIKGGTHMESLARINTVALDKTGTLTEGRFRVVNLKEFAVDMEYNEVMELVAALEVKSSHPVASAIVNHYSGCITDKITTFGAGVGLPDVSNFASLPGLGLTGQVKGHSIAVGNLQMLNARTNGVPVDDAEAIYEEWSKHGQTVIFVVINGKLAMMIGLGDSPRATAKLAVHILKELDVETIMLTGDSKGAAASVVKDVGARSFIANMKPEDKLSWIRERQSVKGKKRARVAMVGDGVNDGPSLAAADVGIAIGACGTALAIESAGVALMSDSLVKIPETLVLSKFTRRIVIENIILALLIKLGVMIATLAGSLTLWMAVLSDVIALLLVILNGFRPLLPKRKKITVNEEEDVSYTVESIEDLTGDYDGIALVQIK
eukprot:gene12801-14114_t